MNKFECDTPHKVLFSFPGGVCSEQHDSSEFVPSLPNA